MEKKKTLTMTEMTRRLAWCILGPRAFLVLVPVAAQPPIPTPQARPTSSQKTEG